eukprot:CAMPEP_0178463218 /NCGR_PEP_ID=MMETSP0689_2-20121128/50222_1 /TAXON_ID=160604 /ORGANISM="Amphidinium massartii, Strain CS-259" /LENGTH=226 /DNA_ID=CAMNT_0020090099 /DNA_START=352 /DNA_END=1035 /DNA_ORIENTATION=+
MVGHLRQNRQFLWSLLGQFGFLLLYASEGQRDDEQFALRAVHQHPRSLEYVSQRLSKNRMIVAASVELDGGALQFASSELQNDKEIVLQAVTQSAHSLMHASEALRNDLDVVLVALQEDVNVILFVDGSVLEDPNFAQKTAKSISIFRVVLLSGRACHLAIPARGLDVVEFIARCSKRLGLTEEQAQVASLLHGATPLKEHPRISSSTLPAILPGCVTELTLCLGS